MRPTLTSIIFIAALNACAIADEGLEDQESEHHHGGLDQEEPFYDELADSLGTVRSQIGRCTTAGIRGLNLQIVEEINCLVPGTLSPMEENRNLRFADGSVLPYMSSSAYLDLLAASSEAEIVITSGFRTSVQQLMIRKWFEAGRCGIKAAARPSRSNHQDGKAIDVRNHAQIAGTLGRHGWRQTVPGDWVHFDHMGSFDLGHIDVLAFQILWNRNHPESPIAEDADYGPGTERALLAAPAAGFPLGSSCE